MDRVGSGHWRCFFCDPSRIQFQQDVCDTVLYYHQRKKIKTPAAAKKLKSTPSNSQNSANSKKKSANSQNSGDSSKKSTKFKTPQAAKRQLSNANEKEKTDKSDKTAASSVEGGKKKAPDSKARLVSAAEIANQGHGDFLQLLKRLENSNRNFGALIKCVKQSVTASVAGISEETVTKLESLASDLCAAIESHAKVELETIRELRTGVVVKISKQLPTATPIKATIAGSLQVNQPSTSAAAPTANHQPASPATSDLSTATPGFENDGVSYAIQTVIS